MKILATRPTTRAELLRRRIALVLDDAFISAPNGLHRLNEAVASDFDGLVEKIALLVEQPVPESFSNSGVDTRTDSANLPPA